jgi:hypothetical protein
MTEKTTPAPKARTAAVRNEGEAPVVLGTASSLDTSPAANIAPATEFSPSGAPRQVTDFDVSNAAVDNDPRAGTTVEQNKIDFNDPSIDGHEAVEQNLKAQSAA